MKMHIKACVLFPVTIDHDFEIVDPTDSCEIEEAIHDMATHIMETSSIESQIEGKIIMDMNGKIIERDSVDTIQSLPSHGMGSCSLLTDEQIDKGFKEV